MGKQRIDIPKGYGDCRMFVYGKAGYQQRVTIFDAYVGKTFGPFYYGGGDQKARFGEATVQADASQGSSYPVDVHIESSGDGGQTWGENRLQFFPQDVPNGSGTLMVLGSEDIGSTDNDYDDCFVLFTFLSLVGQPADEAASDSAMSAFAWSLADLPTYNSSQTNNRVASGSIVDTSCNECSCPEFVDPQGLDQCINFRQGTIKRCDHKRSEHKQP